MSTRGAWGLRKNGQDKLTYNHYDSYPSGLGRTIAEFVAKTPVTKLHGIFDRVELVEEEGGLSPEQQSALGAKPGSTWYNALRYAQGEPDAYLNGLAYMTDGAFFMHDGLCCEWAYVINLDTGRLEVYKGFQTTKGEGRYAGEEPEDGYWGVGLVTEIQLDRVGALWPMTEKLLEPGNGS